MTEEHDLAWQAGFDAAWQDIFAQALPKMGDATRDAHAWRLERADIVRQLRDLCREFGDNDWPDNLHLGDVIEKHLARHLEAWKDLMP